jgi:hypothetical protein
MEIGFNECHVLYVLETSEVLDRSCNRQPVLPEAKEFGAKRTDAGSARKTSPSAFAG